MLGSIWHCSEKSVSSVTADVRQIRLRDRSADEAVLCACDYGSSRTVHRLDAKDVLDRAILRCRLNKVAATVRRLEPDWKSECRVVIDFEAPGEIEGRKTRDEKLITSIKFRKMKYAIVHWSQPPSR